MKSCVAPTGNRGFKILPRRWVVGRAFRWMTRWRRLAHDYEKRTIYSRCASWRLLIENRTKFGQRPFWMQIWGLDSMLFDSLIEQIKIYKEDQSC